MPTIFLFLVYRYYKDIAILTGNRSARQSLAITPPRLPSSAAGGGKLTFDSHHPQQLPFTDVAKISYNGNPSVPFGHYQATSTAICCFATQPPVRFPARPNKKSRMSGFFYLERVMGIEPTQPAWEAGALPLSHTRKTVSKLYHNSRILQAVFSKKSRLICRCSVYPHSFLLSSAG